MDSRPVELFLQFLDLDLANLLHDPPEVAFVGGAEAGSPTFFPFFWHAFSYNSAIWKLKILFGWPQWLFCSGWW
jgi:hypothetical protein